MQTDVITNPAEASGSKPVKVTPPAARRTSRYLTKYEVARVVGERAR